MNSERWQTIEDLFHQALEIPAGERAAFLDSVCNDDQELRKEIESLLLHEQGTEPILGNLISEAANSLNTAQMDEFLGRRIGAYRITGLVGRGGMAEVFLAERADDQYHKKVAIKLIKRGILSEFLHKRFLHERQILANLEHPNIARFLEGGTTESGAPYFVMEYIAGLPITEYSESKDLTTKERVALFRRVCDGVQYAHRQLIVHRDLKPSNIIVTSDGEPKLLDFGIAKLVNPDPNEAETIGQTITTARLMTPDYASPEQVKGFPVTTATDIYSLGAVLYELLTGHRPHQLKNRSIHEIERIVCDQDPEKPSTAATRQTAQTDTGKFTQRKKSHLKRELEGDLDNIVLMAMRKEPQRRYETVNELSEDLARFLEGRPVKARQVTLAYRAGKFVRRHRLAVSAAALLMILLVGFAVAMTLQAARIAQERDRANQLTEFLIRLFEVSDPDEAKGNSITARELLERGARSVNDELDHQPSTQAAMMDTIGRVYRNLGLYSYAKPLFEQALTKRIGLYGEENADVADSMTHLADVLRDLGEYEKAETLGRKAVALRRKLLGSVHLDLSTSLASLAATCQQQSKYDEAEKYFRESLEIRRKILGSEHTDVAVAINNIALVLKIKGDYASAEPLYREALAMRRKLLGNEHPHVAASLHNLARLMHDKGDVATSETLYREALAVDRKVLGEDHPDLAITMNSLANILRAKEDFEGAEAMMTESLRIRRKALGNNHPSVATNIYSLGLVLLEKGDLARAEQLLKEAGDIWTKTLPPGHVNFSHIMIGFGRLHLAQLHPEMAEPLFRDALKIRLSVLGENHPQVGYVKSLLGDCMILLGKREEGLSMLRTALKITEASRGADHPDTQKLREKVSSSMQAKTN